MPLPILTAQLSQAELPPHRNARTLTYNLPDAIEQSFLYVSSLTMTVLLLVLLISVGNFALGFGLAVHLGHGPNWALPRAEQVRDRLRSLLRLGGSQHKSTH